MNLERLQETLIRHEGLRLKAYVCPAGRLSIGVGLNLEDRGITRDEAVYLLNNKIRECVHELRATFPWFDSLDDVRQEVLVNMAYNLGVEGLSKFVFTLAAIKTGNYRQAANRMLQSKWARQVGSRALELSDMMRTGAISESYKK